MYKIIPSYRGKRYVKAKEKNGRVWSWSEICPNWLPDSLIKQGFTILETKGFKKCRT